jgi:hypothetical protein
VVDEFVGMKCHCVKSFIFEPKMKKMFRLVAIVVLLLVGINAFPQQKLVDTDLSKIPQKSIVDFIVKQQAADVLLFNEFHPSVTDSTNLGEFDTNCHVFKLDASPNTAWSYYLKSHPSEVWNGKVVSCGLIYSPGSEKIIYTNDDYDGIEVGQLFIVQLKVFGGIAKFPVAFIVTKINDNDKSITFSYVRSGESAGDQTIRLVDDGNGGTRIIHSSHHLTSNPLRDKTLYPIYHKKAIAEVHRNIRNMIKNSKKEVSH